MDQVINIILYNILLVINCLLIETEKLCTNIASKQRISVMS